MQMIHLIWFIRGLVGLAIGFFIARKSRDFIRSIVIMCIPLKHRISERSFLIQTRVTTLVSILLMIAIAVGLNWGLSKGLAEMGITATTTIQQSSTTPSITWAPKPPASKLANEVTKLPPAPPEVEEITTPTNTFDISNNHPTEPAASKVPPKTTQYPQLRESPMVPQRKMPTSYSQRGYEAYTVYYYAQLYAFSDFNKAQTQLLRWNSHHQLPMRIGYIEQEFAPYKVIIGPFRNRQAATSFLRQHRLKGFARPAHQLQLFE